MEKSTAMVQQGLELGGDLNLALTKISDVVSEVYKIRATDRWRYQRAIGGLVSNFKIHVQTHRDHPGN